MNPGIYYALHVLALVGLMLAIDGMRAKSREVCREYVTVGACMVIIATMPLLLIGGAR